VITVKDNFFSDINQIKTKLQNIPIYDSKQWSQIKNQRVNWQGYRSEDILMSDIELFNYIKDNIETTFHKKFKIKSMVLHERKDKRLNPHTDDNITTDTNCLIYITGKEGIFNGTGFFNKDHLSVNVGFIENRAILFPSNHLHSSIQALNPDKCTSRVTVNCFMNEVQ